jgi:GTP-binding protein
MRASGKDENIMLSPVSKMNLEKALHFIRDDELVEVTPQSIRLRKAELSAQRRRVMYGARKKEAA